MSSTETFDDAFSDSRLAEVIADEVLTDRFIWAKGLDWMGWDDRRWVPVSEESVGEAVRRFAIQRFTEAAKARKAEKGWQAMLAGNRQRSVLSLAKGIVEKQADEFDVHADLLNTPDGVVDLRTGGVDAHNPDLLITKITRGSYRPGFTHVDWNQALSAIRDDAREWLQVRVGQAITGHTTPDGVIPILQGPGENGKTAVMTDGLLPALGDYAAPASPKLIASKSEHSTERADLRGQRLLVAEELTEDRALNVTAIKQIQDVSQIKARLVFKDNITFAASHSLFITTNYTPVVNETDHGTWRRLALLVFPFTFRKLNEPLRGESDRKGDPNLKKRIRAGADGQYDAVVTFAVEGALRWYKDGFPALPSSVEMDTRKWRKEADRILGFWDDQLVADRDACVVTTELHAAFNGWMEQNGHRGWPKELFGSRFCPHAETAGHGVAEGRPRNLDDLSVSRPPGTLEGLPARPRVYIGVRFRTGMDDEKDQRNSTWSERSDPKATFTRETDPRKVDEGLDRLDQACCQGGELRAECKLCERSSVYWRSRDARDSTEEIDGVF